MLDCTGTQRCLLAVSHQNGTDENSLQHKNPGINQPFCSSVCIKFNRMCVFISFSKKTQSCKTHKEHLIPKSYYDSIAFCSPKTHTSLPNWTILPRLNVCWLLQCIIWIHSTFHPITCSISLVAEKNSQSDNIHQGILVRKCCMKIKIFFFGSWEQNLVLESESTLKVVESDIVKLTGVFTGPYLSV